MSDSQRDDDGQTRGARLAAAAPALASALCLVEWQVLGEGFKAACPLCLGSAEASFHDRNCPLDAALTAAGLDADARERLRQQNTDNASNASFTRRTR